MHLNPSISEPFAFTHTTEFPFDVHAACIGERADSNSINLKTIYPKLNFVLFKLHKKMTHKNEFQINLEEILK